MKTRQVIVTELPKGALTAEHFNMVETDLPNVGDGELLVRHNPDVYRRSQPCVDARRDLPRSHRSRRRDAHRQFVRSC